MILIMIQRMTVDINPFATTDANMRQYATVYCVNIPLSLSLSDTLVAKGLRKKMFEFYYIVNFRSYL